jgi:purine nucleoside permease
MGNTARGAPDAMAPSPCRARCWRFLRARRRRTIKSRSKSSRRRSIFRKAYHHLRYNEDLQVLGIVTGEGKSHAAASIMALGLDPRFKLSKAYWLIAAIAGVDPNIGSVASTAWAKFIVDGDLSYQIDAREIPAGWPTGYVPLGRSSPYQGPPQPFFANGVQQVFQLNASLADWAFQQTKTCTCQTIRHCSRSAPAIRISPMR